MSRRALLPLLLLLAAPRSAAPTLSTWSCGAARRRGLRRAQEDFVLLTTVERAGNSSCAEAAPAPQLLGVFDGHEGAAAAAYAARELPAAVAAALAEDGEAACQPVDGEPQWRPDALAASLQRALAAVDAAFCAHAAAQWPPLRDGATAVVALLPGDSSRGFVVAHIGDSRALLCDTPPRLLTTDHAPDAPAERARILAAGGFVAHGRLMGELAVARALGDLPYRRHGLSSAAEAAVHTAGEQATERGPQFLLLVSDGAMERATARQLCDVVAGRLTTQRALEEAAVARARTVIPLGPAAAAVETAAPAAAPAVELDDAASGPLAAAAAAAAEAGLTAGSSDNVAVVACRLDGSSASATTTALVAAPGALLAGRWRLIAPAAVLRGPYPHDVALAEPSAGMSASPWAVDRLQCAALPAVALADGSDSGVADSADHDACARALLALPSGGHAPTVPGESSAALPLQPEPPPLGGGRFRLGTAAGHGHFGEVWHARSVEDVGDHVTYVLKRAPGAFGAAARAAMLREAHFGAAMAGAQHAARFVELFTSSASSVDSHDGSALVHDTWLAFVDEGTSLAALLYGDGGGGVHVGPLAAGGASSLALLSPSAWWLERRASEDGMASLRAVWAGVLSALAEAHARGVAHRDVKPGNVLLSSAAHVRLCDWGSAVDAATLADGLYGAAGPGPGEETPGYAPPEARFGGIGWPGRANVSALFAYDIWSAGVLGLELLSLGTPDVFAPPPRVVPAAARAAAAARLGDAARDALTALRGLAALCIAPPAPSGLAPDAAQCSERELLATLRARDPAARAGGLPLSPWALRLLRRMLAWDPNARPTAARALQHAYFAAPRDGHGFACAAGGPEAEWPDECDGAD